MKIYISGISGTAMGPLALMAIEAGIEVVGSDKAEGAISNELRKKNIEFFIGEQDGSFLEQKNTEEEIDWFVYTSALPKEHPELLMARRLELKISKRDELIAFLIEKLNLKMIAVAGTHGKTTTTSMIIWAALKLGIPISYLVGTTLGFAESGRYDEKSRFLVYEADEYDRNFLYFHPWVSGITNVSYDHPDIYKTREEYQEAFLQFEQQSENVVKNTTLNKNIAVAGEARKFDATLALEMIKKITDEPEEKIIAILNVFPGVGRRFERISEGVYSDYAHHPEEIEATLNVANEEAKKCGFRGIVAIYEPHQNTRQHEVRDGYKRAFIGAEKIFFLPTFLVREDSNLAILTPEDLISTLENKDKAVACALTSEFGERIKQLRNDGFLILLMSAGPADKWLRELFA